MIRSRFTVPLVALALASATAAAAPLGETKVIFHGHSAFEIVTPTGKVLFVDPWLSNPAAKSKDAAAQVKRADWILITHGHFDHVGEAAAIAKKTGARLVAPFELGQNLARVGGYPARLMGFDTLGNPGGELALDGEVTVAFTPAVHGSGIESPDAAKGAPMVYGGAPVGFVIQIKNGPTIYHTGDTAYFRDMEEIGERFTVDLALINIGGHFGMEVPAAARAAKAVKAKLVVPHHYKTFPVITQDAKPFFQLLDKEHIAHRELAVEQTLFFDGANPRK